MAMALTYRNEYSKAIILSSRHNKELLAGSDLLIASGRQNIATSRTMLRMMREMVVEEGKIVELTDKGIKAVQPGVTTDYIDAVVHEACITEGGYPSPLNYMGFPKSVCTSINEVICHGIPNNRPLQNGDIVNVDYDGGKVIKIISRSINLDLYYTYICLDIDNVETIDYVNGLILDGIYRLIRNLVVSPIQLRDSKEKEFLVSDSSDHSSETF